MVFFISAAVEIMVPMSLSYKLSQWWVKEKECYHSVQTGVLNISNNVIVMNTNNYWFAGPGS